MSPSRTRGAPTPEGQQRIETTILRLNALAKLDSLQGFADAVVWADQIRSTNAAVAYACTADDAGDVGSYNKLLDSFYCAICNGQKQLTLTWPQEASPAAAHTRHDRTLLGAAMTVGYLCRALSGCRVLDWYKQDHNKREVESAIKAGFLQHFTALSTKLTSALQGTAAQHAAGRQIKSHRLAALHLLDLFCRIFQSWPGCKLSDSSLTASIEPAARLAFAMMRAAPADATPADSNSSRFNSITTHLYATTLVDRDLWIDSCHASVCLAHCLSCVVHNECCVGLDLNSSNVSSSPRSALVSVDVQRLLFVCLAAVAAVMHRQQPEASTPPPAAAAADRASHTLQPDNLQQGQGRQHADDGYVQLLVGLGFTDADELVDALIKQGAPDVHEALQHRGFQHRMLTVVGYLYRTFCHLQEKDGSANAGSSSTDLSPPSHAGKPTLLQQLALPVLHTLKDLALLLPDDDVEAIGRVIWVYGGASRAVKKPSCHSPEELQQVVQWLLQPMYLKMCKALRTCSQQQQITETSWSTDVECDLARTWAVAVQVLLAMSELSVQDYLVEAIKQDPVTTLAAMEAVARVFSASTGSKQQQMFQPASSFVTSVLTGPVHHDAVKDVLSPPAVQQQLLSLVLCQLKLLMLVSDSPQTTSTGREDLPAYLPAYSFLFTDLQNIASIFRLLIAVDNRLIDTQQSLPSEVKQALHYARLAVVGRTMFVSAVSLLKHMPIPYFVVCIYLQPWVDLAQQGTALVLHAAGDHSKAALAAAEVDKLLEQLMEQVETLNVADTADDEEASRQVLHQLQQCGSAICAALPVKFCCNNPACVNLAKLSEQQLVAGKGSRCSGCKVARYCSRECQVKHWKQHKQACKRIQAEAGVVASSS